MKWSVIFIKPQIICSSDPYKLDYIDVADKKIPALTRKNADFIEAIVHLDSNYAKDLEINQPAEKYNPEDNAEDSKGLYCGSTAYWFDKLKRCEKDEFQTCILGTVISIDTTNSTHLETCVSGRKKMRNVICGMCSDYKGLIELIEAPFNANETNHMIARLTEGIEQKGESKKSLRYNLSFASKYCAYAAQFLECKRQYSKYDNVVSDALPYYVEAYLGKKIKKNEFKVPQKKMAEEEKFDFRLNLFEKYSMYIDEILHTLEQEKISLSRIEFDYIIWYGLKGL